MDGLKSPSIFIIGLRGGFERPDDISFASRYDPGEFKPMQTHAKVFSMTEIPKQIPCAVTDKAVYCLEVMVDLIIQLEMEFDHRLDTQRLARAVRLALDAEPILGCRFVYDHKRPYWHRLDNDEIDHLIVTADANDYQNFRLQGLDALEGPQLQACLLQQDGGDKLLLKIGHVATDAGGVKEIGALVASLYNRLAKEPDYVPEPNLQSSRGVWQFMRRLPWYEYPRVFYNYIRTTLNKLVPLPTHHLLIDGDPGKSELFVYDIPAEQVSRLAAYGAERRATLNDILMAAFFRAQTKVAEWDRESQLRLYFTADLRRYIPGGRGDAPVNMSALEFMRLGTDLGDHFDDTLAKVSARTRRMKSNWIGLADYAVAVPLGFMLPYGKIKNAFNNFVAFSLRKKNIANSFTNMGPIPVESVSFDKPARMARLLPPIALPPHILAAASGYNGALTLTTAYNYREDQAEIMNRLMMETVAELPA